MKSRGRPPGTWNERRFWNQEARAWERWEPVLMHSLGGVNSFLLKTLELEPGHRIIDVGCGTGDPALAIAQWVGPRGHVLGVDLSEAMLAVARRRARALGIGNVRFRRADMNRLPARGARFDRAVSRFGLMFATDPAAVLERIRMRLNAAGKLVAAVWSERSQGHRLRVEVMRPFVQPPTDLERTPHPMRFGRSGMLARLFRGAGFREVESRKVRVCAVYASVDDYVSIQRETAMIETFRALDRADQQRLERRMRRRVGRFKDGEVLRVPGEAWVVSGLA